jgi:hypothetical protein
MKTSCACACAAAFCAAVLGSGGPVQAGFTEFKANPKEPDQQEILDHLLGGSFAPSGVDFTNGSITAQRINDADDQKFSGHTFDAKAAARFSDFTQSFGIFNNGFEKKFDVTGHQYSVSGSATVKLTQPTALGRSGNSGTDSSVDSQNADGLDHMLTYKINGDGSQSKYLLFWEDLEFSSAPGAPKSPRDFNDVVIELSADDHSGNGGNGGNSGNGGDGGNGGNLIPLPPALISGGLMLGALLLQRAYSRRALA